MRTFSIQTLGCKVNHYETEQWATLLRARGLTQVDPADADLRVINSCSVTTEAASKSRQLARRATRLPVLGSCGHDDPNDAAPTAPRREPGATRARVIVTGCWATSDRSAAAALQGIDAVITHHDDVAAELTRLLSIWLAEGSAAVAPRPNAPTGDRENPGRLTKSDEVPPNQEQVLPTAAGTSTVASGRRPESLGNDEWMTTSGGLPGLRRTPVNKSPAPHLVKEIPVTLPPAPPPLAASRGQGSGRKQTGTPTLPLLHQRQPSHQRAHLKIQDGCDAHCTYCIIPSLRPALWTKPIREAVEEAKRLTDAGHVELVLTGIFLGAYGHPTALRRRQVDARETNLTALIDALCTDVPGLKRLRLSSLEPGDLTPDLIAALKSHPQVVPHFHLPLQSGSDRILRRMNRQYTRADFLHMADAVHAAFDRPALTTDVIAGFPGEADEDFARTVEVVERVGFIHVHAFPFSPRPGTAAARWKDQFVHGTIAGERIARLRALAARGSVRFRNQFLGRTVELLVERWDEKGDAAAAAAAPGDLRHGRSERYFDVFFDGPDCRPGDAVRVRIDRVTESRTFGTRVPMPPATTRGDA